MLLLVSATFNDQNRPNFVVGTAMEICSNFNFISITLHRTKMTVTTNTFRCVKCTTGKSDIANDAALDYCHQPSFPRWKTV
jgi:hypothetical protein